MKGGMAKARHGRRTQEDELCVARLAALGLLAAVACGASPASPSQEPTIAVSIPPAVSPEGGVSQAPPLTPASRAAAHDGLYFVAADRKDTCALVGQWLACFGLPPVRSDDRGDPILLAVSSEGDTLRPLRASAPSFTLSAPAQAGGAWTLRGPGGEALTQRSDPYLARIEEHLAGRVFVRLESQKALRPGDAPEYSKDTITMADALVATVDIERLHDCAHALVFPDPTWNRSIPLRPATPPPAAGQLGMRTYALMKLELECKEPVDPRAPIGIHGALGGARLFAEADGEPVGLVLEGYMYAETFVTRAATREAIGRMISAAAVMGARQAE
jgi:hypothetical protein